MSKVPNPVSLGERAVMQAMLDHGCSLRAISRDLAHRGGAVADAVGFVLLVGGILVGARKG